MLSSRICSGILLLVLMLLSRAARAQEKNGEFKHELPEGVELVDPKSLGLTDVDLSKFLGNVKVLGGGQVGDTKTQILTVGFEGDENINFNDFTIPGLTDGNNTALPEKDKEIADMAFQKFKAFFNDPNKAKQFEEGNKDIAFAPQKHNNEPPKHRSHPQQNNVHQQQHHPPQLRIPMIQKPYTTPRTPQHHPGTAHHSRPLHRQIQPPPPPHPSPPVREFNPSTAQTQNQQHQHHSFNSQIKSQPPLEFGARIPVGHNQHRPPPQPQQQQQQQQQFQHHNQGQYQFQRQQEHQQQHRLTVQHQQQGQTFQRPSPPPPQPQNNNQPPQHQSQHHFQHQRAPPQAPHQGPQAQTPRIRFPQEGQPPRQGPPQFPPGVHAPPQFPPIGHPSQPPPVNPSPVSHVPLGPRPPLVQNFVIHPHPQQHQQQNIIQHQPPAQRDQGRIVRNQLLQFERNNQESNYDGPSKGLLPPPPPQSYQSSSNHIPVHSPLPPHLQNQQPATAAATSSVYIHHGPKSPKIQQTSFHPQFQAPTRFAKDFTPMPIQTTTSRPSSFEVTPSMPLIPLSTNENAITDPTRMLQLRLYQQQKAQAQAQAQASNTHQTQAVLPQQTAPTPPTTTPISITTSYPETGDSNQQFSSPTQYELSGSQQSYDQNNNIAHQINDNEIYNNAPFALQSQQQQQQLHFVQDSPSSPPQQQHQFHQSNQPTVFYTQEHRRPPRQGPPRFQFHVSHELGQGPRFQMHPDPKSLLNTIRRKRGYRKLSNLFNRMFRWDRH